MSKDDYHAREAQRKADEARHQAANQVYRQAAENKANYYASERKKTMDAWEESGRKTSSRQNSGSTRSSGCFPRGTNIVTPFGLRDISTLREGDFVIAVNDESGKKLPRKILRKLTHPDMRIWMLSFTDGDSVRTTAVHSFLIDGQWEKASRIEPGDRISTFDAGSLGEKIVKSSHQTNDAEEVYNLIVEGDFSFVADGLVAHSFTYLKTARAWAWTLREAACSVARRLKIAFKSEGNTAR